MTNQQYVHERFELKYKENEKMNIPLLLNNYTIDKVIEENGDKCIILSSTKPDTHEKVAIKCIPIKHVQPDNKEVELMKKVSNRYIIKCIDSFYYPKQKPRFFSIVMPRAITDLFYYLQSHGPFTDRFCCRIMKQALQAVNHLHENNIWHRDLKLENIFVLNEVPEGIDIIVADLGLAGVFENETFNGFCVGSIYYAAPELVFYDHGKLEFKTTAKYSNKIDTWAMGVVLYALLSGVLPFDSGIEEDVENFFNGTPDFDEENPSSVFQNVTLECKDLIQQMLQVDPNMRISIKDALEHQWFRMYEDEHAYEAGYQANREIINVVNDNDNGNDDDTITG